jgi:geranylgeranyl diphosphate synthase type I
VTVATDIDDPALRGPRLDEHVVLLDERGRPTGTATKATAHTDATSFHLAFSCHLVDDQGRVLLTRRALTKRTWPGVWTNGCCGHPQAGETLREAVVRRVGQELGMTVTSVALALPDFAYRAAMPDGTVEHELCPVVLARVAGEPVPDPVEVDDFAWVPWRDLQRRVEGRPGSLSPWSVEQVRQLSARSDEVLAWFSADGPARAGGLLDLPITLDPARQRRIDVESTLHRGFDLGGGALSSVHGPLRTLLGGFLAEKTSEITAIDARLAEVVDEVRALVDAGGKRLRPAFVWWGHRATGAAADDAVLRPAAAVELLHTFALLHDDVMDRSTTRRGRPSAYAALAARHADDGRLGDGDWFGCSAAILAGDLTYVWADELFDGTDLAPDAVARARAVFTTLRSEVIAGQYLDLVLATDRTADEERARQVAMLKSARYTVTRPLLLGAALAPEAAGAKVAAALTIYGDAVGLAFQMRDDILGLFGNPAVTGKSTVDDLREGKRTLLALRALRLADDAQRRLLLGCLGDAELTSERAAAARAVVADTGALASVEALLRAEHATAVAAIQDIPEPARAALTELADLAIERSA